MAIRAVRCLLDGAERELRLDLGSWAALEDQGYDLDAMLGQLREGKLKMRGVQTLLWAMLQGEDAPPTLKQVGRWVDGANFRDALAKVGEAMKLAFPEVKESPPSPPVGAGTGTKPSASVTVLSG